MRELPADFVEKRDEYIRIGTNILARFDIPPELVVNADETSSLLAPRAKQTRFKKGAKRVRIVGVGHEKTQLTVTLAITESGDVLPAQIIFGGKTNACHPNKGKSLPPPGIFYDHTDAHWQSVASWKRWIINVLIPYKDKIINEFRLSHDQKLLLKVDLHFTHKDSEVMQLYKENNIIPLFVPAKCTDELQECDVALNSPFKVGLRAAFRNYLHDKFNEHVESGAPAAEFKASLSVGELKPHFPDFVLVGLAAIKTPVMKETIKEVFAKDGCFEIMRHPDRIAAARARILLDEPEIFFNVLNLEEEEADVAAEVLAEI